jgi:hypothetical protein
MALEFTYIILDATDHPVRDPENHDPIQFSTIDDAENAIVERSVGRGARVIPFTDWIDTVSELN